MAADGMGGLMMGTGSIPLDRCPQCGGSVEHGFVYGDRGLFWDTKIRKVGFPAEMLTQERLGPLEAMPGVRCRSCRLVVFQHRVSKTRHGPLGGYR